jgi:protein-S-isoprenylcysteine O-methyltransferase Ste14
MGRILAVPYGVICYALFVVTFLYAIGFTGNLLVPRTIDSGTPSGFGVSLLVNLLLLGLFAVQHSVMARPAFKKWWTQFVPEPFERSTYVLLSSLALLLLYWLWQPMPEVIWHVDNAPGRMVLWGLFWIGWLTVFGSSFIISHWDLFGLRQVWLHFRRQTYTHPSFVLKYLYRFVRHPLMLGFLIAFWAVPHMSAGHLLFSIATTGYILIGIQLEERDLRTFIGPEYDDYRRRVPMLVPMPWKGGGTSQ